jgi:[acyl-carrier-protein] S-malonyltransferase
MRRRAYQPVPAALLSSHMTGLALLFPGQGAQRPGMDAGLRHSDSGLLTTHLERAAAASGLPLERLCAEGPTEALMRTEVAQPALFAVSLALADVAHAIGLRPMALAGHSLGEYTAAVAAGALTPEDGACLVAERGRLMAGAQRHRPGAMAAILGLSPDIVEALCARAACSDVLAVANFNAPTQTVVSGDESAVERLLRMVGELDAGRGVRLPVGAAFHSSLMRPIQAELGETVSGFPWHDAEAPVASNASGELVCTGSGVRTALMAQIASPVRWVACVQALLTHGCRHFLELGPGRVLTGLVRQIAPDADVAAADSREAIVAYVAKRPHLITA